MGTFFSSYFGGYLIGGTVIEGSRLTAAQRVADAQATQLPYALVAAVLALLAVIWRSN